MCVCGWGGGGEQCELVTDVIAKYLQTTTVSTVDAILNFLLQVILPSQ